MTSLEKLAWLEANAVSLHLECNDHRCYYDTLADDLATRNEELFDDDEQDIRAECLRRNTLWIAQCYPVTPIGFYRVGHYDLDEVIDRIYLVVSKELAANDPSASDSSQSPPRSSPSSDESSGT